MSYNLSQSLTPYLYQFLNCILFSTVDNREQFFRNYLVQHYLVCRRRRVTVLHVGRSLI